MVVLKIIPSPKGCRCASHSCVRHITWRSVMGASRNWRSGKSVWLHAMPNGEINSVMQGSAASSKAWVWDTRHRLIRLAQHGGAGPLGRGGCGWSQRAPGAVHCAMSKLHHRFEQRHCKLSARGSVQLRGPKLLSTRPQWEQSAHLAGRRGGQCSSVRLWWPHRPRPPRGLPLLPAPRYPAAVGPWWPGQGQQVYRGDWAGRCPRGGGSEPYLLRSLWQKKALAFFFRLEAGPISPLAEDITDGGVAQGFLATSHAGAGMQRQSVKDTMALRAPTILHRIRNSQAAAKLCHKNGRFHFGRTARRSCKEGSGTRFGFGTQQGLSSGGGTGKLDLPRGLIKQVRESFLFHAQCSSGGQGVNQAGTQGGSRRSARRLQDNSSRHIGRVNFFARNSTAPTEARKAAGASKELDRRPRPANPRLRPAWHRCSAVKCRPVMLENVAWSLASKSWKALAWLWGGLHRMLWTSRPQPAQERKSRSPTWASPRRLRASSKGLTAATLAVVCASTKVSSPMAPPRNSKFRWSREKPSEEVRNSWGRCPAKSASQTEPTAMTSHLAGFKARPSVAPRV